MTEDLSNVIKTHKNNVSNLNIFCSGDTNNYNSNNKTYDYCVQFYISAQTAIKNLRFGSFYKLMMDTCYQCSLTFGEKMKDFHLK